MKIYCEHCFKYHNAMDLILTNNDNFLEVFCPINKEQIKYLNRKELEQLKELGSPREPHGS